MSTRPLSRPTSPEDAQNGLQVLADWYREQGQLSLADLLDCLASREGTQTPPVVYKAVRSREGTKEVLTRHGWEQDSVWRRPRWFGRISDVKNAMRLRWAPDLDYQIVACWTLEQIVRPSSSG